jgi:hypothetical protein
MPLRDRHAQRSARSTSRHFLATRLLENKGLLRKNRPQHLACGGCRYDIAGTGCTAAKFIDWLIGCNYSKDERKSQIFMIFF